MRTLETAELAALSTFITAQAPSGYANAPLETAFANGRSDISDSPRNQYERIYKNACRRYALLLEKLYGDKR